MSGKNKMRNPWGISAAMAAAGVLLSLASVFVPGFASGYRAYFYLPAAAAVSRVSGLFPFSLSEVLLAAVLLGLLFRIVLCLLGKARVRDAASYAAAALSAGFLLYTVFCGVNYRAESFAGQAGLAVRESSAEELENLCRCLAEQVNLHAADPGSLMKPSLREQAEEGRRAMEALGEEFPGLKGRYPAPKFPLFSRFFTVQQVTGIYSPFCVEANCNREIPGYNMPFTICHELSHLRGWMREDEANFIGFLAASRSTDPWFSYSGWLSGWVYAGNALASADREAFREIYGTLCARAREDMRENNLFWEQYDGTYAEAHERINDTYLKAQGQRDGTKSYGRMVDLMLAYYREHPCFLTN